MFNFSIRFLFEVTVFASFVCLALFGTAGELGFYLMIVVQFVILGLLTVGIAYGETDARAFCLGCLPIQIVFLIDFCVLSDESLFLETIRYFRLGSDAAPPFYTNPLQADNGHIAIFFAFFMPMLLSGFASLYLYRRLRPAKVNPPKSEQSVAATSAKETNDQDETT